MTFLWYAIIVYSVETASDIGGLLYGTQSQEISETLPPYNFLKRLLNVPLNL